MSKFLQIRTFTLLALAASLVLAPACDAGSDRELAEQLGVSLEELADMSAEELEAHELEIRGEPVVTHHPRPRPEATTTLRNPLVHTHTETALARLGDRPRPTHGGDLESSLDEIIPTPDDQGCDTHGDDSQLAAR